MISDDENPCPQTIGGRFQLSDGERGADPEDGGADHDWIRATGLEQTTHAVRAMMEDRISKGQDVGDAPRLVAEAEEALRAGDMKGADACMRMAYGHMMEHRGLEEELEWVRWLLATLSLFEDVPQGIMDAFSKADGLYQDGDRHGTKDLVDRLRRTAQNRLLEHWKELRRFTKRQYKMTRGTMDAASRKEAWKLMSAAASLGRSKIPHDHRRALRLVQRVHRLVLPRTEVPGGTARGDG